MSHVSTIVSPPGVSLRPMAHVKFKKWTCCAVGFRGPYPLWSIAWEVPPPSLSPLNLFPLSPSPQTAPCLSHFPHPPNQMISFCPLVLGRQNRITGSSCVRNRPETGRHAVCACAHQVFSDFPLGGAMSCSNQLISLVKK